MVSVSDDLGYVTTYEVCDTIENGFGGLFFSKYKAVNVDPCQVYGTKESIVEFSNERDGECMRFCEENLNTNWNPYRFIDCTRTFIQYLVRLGVLMRTEYTKDSPNGGTARCYSINRNR